MKKKTLMKKVSVVTVFTILVSSLSAFAPRVFAEEPVTEEIQSEWTEEMIKEANEFQLSDKVLSDDFELDEEVENLPSVHEMSPEERAIFDQNVAEQALAYEGEDKEKFVEVITDFFDETSGHANDLQYAQETLVNAEFSDIETGTMVHARAIQVRIKNSIAGTVFDVALGAAVGGGTVAVRAFIIKKGKKEAARVFTRTVKSRLIAWGAPKLAVSAGLAVEYALNALDLGNTIAKQFDKRDKRPNNGYIDFY